MATRCALVLACAMALAVAPALAQTSDFTLPPNSILPNYDRVSIGQREGLEAGAYVARTNDAAASWFNPAGLVQSEKSALAASANAFELTRLSLEGIGASESSTRFSPVGTLVAGVVGAPIVSSRQWRLGFSYARPVSWVPSTLTGQIQTDVGAGREVFGYSTGVSFSSSVFGASAGYQASPRLRLGVGLGYSITDLNQSQAVSDRLLNADSAPTVLRSVATDGSAHHLLLSGAAQWAVTPSLSVGALIVSPGLRIGGESSILFSNVRLSADGSRDIAFRDEKAKFDYKIPLRATVGAALRFGAAEVEADLRFHNSESRYDMLSSSEVATVITTNAAGVPSTSTLAFAPVTNAARRVYNVGIGGNYVISQTFRVHAGFFTDDSPVDDPTGSIFRSVDLRGASAGVSLKFSQLSGSVGVSSSWGTASERAVGPSLGGIEGITRVQVRTFNFLYALSFAF